MEPSPQQSAFIEAMRDEPDHLVMDSRAGTGKTTTAVMGANELDPGLQIVATCFNKSIATTLSEKMPDNCLCKTFHALGLAAWTANTGSRPQVDSKKIWKISKEMGLKFDQFPDLARIVGLAKNLGIVPKDDLGEKGLAPDTFDQWQSLFDDFGLDPGEQGEDEAIDIARGALITSVEWAYNGIIDFDDMVYMPAVFGGPLPIPKMVLVDEVQDTNPVQLAMVRKMASSGRLAAFGDPHQAIYAFRGADASAMQKVIDEFSAMVMPLTVSYRCPQAVVAEAQGYVTNFEAHQSNPVGMVTKMKSWRPSMFDKRDAILCRNNKPLIRLAFNLIREGIGCYVKGKEIGQGLVKLIDRMKCKEMRVLYLALEDFLIAERNKLTSRGKEAQAANLADRVESLLCLMDRLPDSATIKELKSLIDTMFDEKRGLLTLSTIHKAKGLEWPRVFFLDSHLLPSKFCKTAAQRQQEDNLSYVAITRAQDTLVYIDSEGQE